jgi:putative ABC transport system permease protein
MLLRSPGFALVAVLMLALGIGSNTVIYSLADGILFRPLPFPEPDRLVAVAQAKPSRGWRQNPLSYPNFHDWRAGSRSVALAAYAENAFNLAGGERPEHVSGASVSASLFEVIGISPRLGRGLLPEEDREGGRAVVVLSDSLWRSHFRADPSILGKTVRLDGEPRTVVGVMPPGFDFPTQTQLWVPLALSPTQGRGSNYLQVVGRLHPGASHQQAEAELNTVARQLEQEYPASNSGWRAEVIGFREAGVGNGRIALYLMMGAVGFVLLIACANLANLLLARGAVRQREIAVRAALGAGRGRIVRQLLSESVLLGLLGGALGVLLAFWGVAALRATFPPSIPSWVAPVIDARVLFFTTVMAVGTALVFGVVPALRAARTDVQTTLRSAGRGSGGTPERGRLRNALVVGQIALSLVLLVGATLLIRSFLQLQSVEPGFQREGVVAARLALSGPEYPGKPARIAFWNQLVDRVQAIPSVQAVGAVSTVPLRGSYTAGVAVEGKDVPPGDEPSTQFQLIAGEYLQALCIPLLRGRPLTAAETMDTSGHLALIGATAARHFWPGADPLGKRFRLTGGDSVWHTVVGIVADIRQGSLAEETRNQVYIPFGSRADRGMIMLVRTSGPPAAAIPMIRRAVSSVDPNLPIYDAKSLNQITRESLWSERLLGWLFASFAAIALVLAVTGIYSVMAFLVTQRTHEIGVRMALGARQGEVLQLVLRRGLMLTLVGVAVGIAGAFALTRLLASMLYGVQPTDPATFVGVSLLLPTVALLAAFLPARRATRVDPMIALRSE